MSNDNRLSFLVYGRYALFTDAVTRAGGGKFSYQIPTYQAIKGITESVYWKPTLIWYVDRLRVMNPIQTESKGVGTRRYGGGGELCAYTYLRDVAYQVEVHFEWNPYRPETAGDRNEDKHYQIARRMIGRGGRRDIFLGARECQGYVEPCVFGEGAGAYDDAAAVTFGVMYHSMVYPGESPRHLLQTLFWRAEMINGVVRFPRPEKCTMYRHIRPMEPKVFEKGVGVSGWERVAREEGL